MMPTISLIPLLALFVLPALARTDLAGCTSSISGNSIIYAVPGTGELCQFLDCGGGRAPVKTNVPGCAAYAGTDTYSPSYLAGYGPGYGPTTAAAPPTAVVAATSGLPAGPAGTNVVQAGSVATGSLASQTASYNPVTKQLPPMTFPTSSPTSSAASRSINGTISVSTLSGNGTTRVSSTAGNAIANATASAVLGSGAGREYGWGVMGLLAVVGGVVV